MGYYDIYLKRQSEIVEESMEAARRELLQQQADQQAYRDALQTQLTDLDKTIAHYEKELKKPGGLSTADRKWVHEQRVSARARASSQILAREKFGLQIDKDTRFPTDRLQSLNEDLTEARTKPDPDAALNAVLSITLNDRNVLQMGEQARQKHSLANQSYAVGLSNFIENQLQSGGHRLNPTQIQHIKNQVAAATDTDPDSLTSDVVESRRKNLRDTTVAGVPVTGYTDIRELEKVEAELENLSEEQRTAIKIRKAQLLEEDAPRAEVQGRLDALGAPIEVTEEAVRARAGEIARPQLYEPTPFGAPQERARGAISAGRERRLADLVEGREARVEGEKVPRLEDARIRRLERVTGANDPAVQFAKLSDDQKIMVKQGIRALKAYRGAGSVLPEDQDSIEWKRAQQMFKQMQDQTLTGGSNVIRIATDLAKKDLGSGAPASDIRRHRDEIMERFLMLTVNQSNATAASTPEQEAKEQVRTWDEAAEDGSALKRREEMLEELALDDAIREGSVRMLEDETIIGDPNAVYPPQNQEL
jgi:hypothetical protein